MNAPLPLVVLRQVPADPPAAFSKAMPPELFARLRLRPVAVLFLDQQPAAEGDWQWGGYCNSNKYTQTGEVVLDSRLVESSQADPTAHRIQSMYLHEVAHRLMPRHGHNAAFHALVFMRVGETNGRCLWHLSQLYDFQDEDDLPRAFTWAWNTACQLAAAEETAERCAQIIEARYAAWRKWVADEPARKAKAAARARAHAEQIQWLKDSRWIYAMAGVVAGAVAIGLLALRSRG